MSSTTERWYWLDWLRVLAMGTIFFYHSGRPFIIVPWHITSPEPDMLFTLVNIFVTGWIMPLFFTVSGIATYFSLSRRSPGQYSKSRFLRLMVPFIFALFTILAVHAYFDAVFNGYFTGSFFDFYFWVYFIYAFPLDLFPRLTYFAGANQGIYLWYLFWLFIFSLVTVYLFKWLNNEENRRRISKLATICNRRGGIFLLAIPLIIVDLAAIPPFFEFPSGYGGWKLPTYLTFFILAYVVASDTQFIESIDKNGYIALVVGIITSVLVILAFAIGGIDFFASTSGYLLGTPLWAFNGWCWMVALLFLGRKFLSFNHKFLGFSNELVLPFYVLHQTAIVAVAFFVVGMTTIVMVKYFIIFSLSFAIIAILLIPIRQINVLRFLFGMRLKKSS
jgi:hypothetical protein